MNSCLFRGGSLCSPSQCWDPIWLEPVRVSCVLLPSLWGHTYIQPVLPGGHYSFGAIHPIYSYNLSIFSSTWIPEPWREGLDEDIPFRTECSQVSPTLPIVQLWVSVLILYVLEYREAKLVPDLKLQYYWPAFIVLEWIPHTAGGGRELSISAVTDPTADNSHTPEEYINTIVTKIPWEWPVAFWLALRPTPLDIAKVSKSPSLDGSQIMWGKHTTTILFREHINEITLF